MKKKLSRSQFLRVMLFWWKKWESSLSMMERRLKEAKEEIGHWSKKYQNSEKESTFFLMDKFGVGDEFDHELSMSVVKFPIKSYLIKQRRAQLNIYIWNYAWILNRIICLSVHNSHTSEKKKDIMANNFGKF